MNEWMKIHRSRSWFWLHSDTATKLSCTSSFSPFLIRVQVFVQILKYTSGSRQHLLTSSWKFLRQVRMSNKSNLLTFSEGGWGSAGTSTMLPCIYDKSPPKTNTSSKKKKAFHKCLHTKVKNVDLFWCIFRARCNAACLTLSPEASGPRATWTIMLTPFYWQEKWQ